MAIYILGPDSNGDCCTCAERVNVCDVCGPVTGSCCSFSNASANPLIECYSAYSISGSTATSGPGATATIVDGGVIDTFAPGTVTLSRSITLSVSAPNQDNIAFAQSSPSWVIAMAIDGDVTVSSNGSIWGHDCAGLGAYFYRLDANCQYNPDFGPTYTAAFNDLPCDTSAPSTWGGSQSLSIAAGSYVVQVLSGPAFVSCVHPGEEESCYPPGGEGAIDVFVSFVGDLVPLPLLIGDFQETAPGCNRMFLPFHTESTNNWYADQTAAATAISTQTSNCVGWTPVVPPGFTFIATNGGSSLSFSWAFAAGSSDFFGAGSVNGQIGEIISVSWSATPGGSIGIVIYNFAAQVVEIITSSSSPAVSATLPYTGRYIIEVTLLKTASDLTAGSAAISSSGLLSVNPIQALYHVGLDCPARLDCS